MHHHIREENAALLTANMDEEGDDDNLHNNNNISDNKNNNQFNEFQIVQKQRPKTYHKSTSNHPVLLFLLIMSGFILGCITGITVMLYRISQDAESTQMKHSSASYLDVDKTVKTKLFDIINGDSILNFSRSIPFQIYSAGSTIDNDFADRLYRYWHETNHSSVFDRFEKRSYDIKLPYYTNGQMNGLEILGSDENRQEKFDQINGAISDLSSSLWLTTTGKIKTNLTYFVNYGRAEDFNYISTAKRLNLQNSLVFIRNGLIPRTEKIRRAINYFVAGIVLFDDDDLTSFDTTKDFESVYEEFSRYYAHNRSSVREYLDNYNENHMEKSRIPVITLSKTDVQKILSTVQSPQWQDCPSEWQKHSQNNSNVIHYKLGGELKDKKLFLLTTNVQDVQLHVPYVIGMIKGTIEADHFIIIGIQRDIWHKQTGHSGRTTYGIFNEIIRSLESKIQVGWRPRRSIVFCAWSGTDYDQFSIRKWLMENFQTLNRQAVAYIDLGRGIMGNSTLNLHSSPLLKKVALAAADSIDSPLTHNHTCHHRKLTTDSPMPEEHQHGKKRRRRHGGDDEETDKSMSMSNDHMGMAMGEEKKQEEDCPRHKLFDEWLRVTKKFHNNTEPRMYPIDSESSAAVFNLQLGIPSIVIEMTNDEMIPNDIFYVKKSTEILMNDENTNQEVLVAYTRFVAEFVRQLSDEPLIPFNLTDYANALDESLVQYQKYFRIAHNRLHSFMGDLNDFISVVTELSKSIRQLQNRMDKAPKNDYVFIQNLNQQLLQFERLFIDSTTKVDIKERHLLIGSAHGHTNTVVGFPGLSNVLFNLPEDPPEDLCDLARVQLYRLKDKLQQITRTLYSIDGLFL